MAAQSRGDGPNPSAISNARGEQYSDDQFNLDQNDNRQLARRQQLTSSEADSKGYNAPQNSFSVPKNNAAIGKAGLADFFSQEVFQIVLHNPTTAHRLLKFSQARMCGENMEFLEKVDRYNALLDELTTIMSEIYYSYTSNEAEKQLGLPSNMMKRVNADIKTSTTNTLPSMETIFSDAQANVENILRTSVYPRFVKYQMTNSASRALSTDREKYQGLGDCFCLTDPHKADNPIVFASDGFVNVTGYERAEVVPRNCRFLQGNYTDRSAVKRLKTSIDGKEEIVELLLNYKKNGEPFWNLLYVAPLYDANGKLVFYIGAQINCSTTIRSNTDVLRILSTSDDPEEDKEIAQSIRSQKKEKRSFFGFIRKDNTPKILQSSKNVEVRDQGMEPALLKQIENMNFRTQMELFYTTYSKYLIISYPSLLIHHYSPGILTLLNQNPQNTPFPHHPQTPTSHNNNNNNPPILGTDIFRFLSQHTLSLPREFKQKVKHALKNGQAISASVNLFTLRSLRRARGGGGGGGGGGRVDSISGGGGGGGNGGEEERFFSHWTPVKDERGGVGWVVVTLSESLYT